MAAIKIKNDIYHVGVLNPNLRIFDIIMKTEYGTSYNSYIVKGSEKTVLIDSVHEDFFETFIENIEQVCNIQDIDYLIMNHNEPDHSGSIVKLLELNPNITIFSSQAGSIYLKNITNNPNIVCKVVKDNDTLSLGDKELRFINAPFLHWPDSMFTYLESESVLFSCDFFGAHYCEPSMWDKRISFKDKYEEAFRVYFDAIFSPFKPYVIKGLDKIKDLSIDYICTSHGPILTKDVSINTAIEKYREWSQKKTYSNKRIPIFYCSAYGNTEKVANYIKSGILETIPTAEVELFDIIKHDISALAEKLNESNGFLIGSPTINRDAVPPVWELIMHIDAINNQKKHCAAFGSFGWSGEAVSMINQRLSDLKLSVLDDGFKFNFVPSISDAEQAKEFGREFARKII